MTAPRPVWRSPRVVRGGVLLVAVVLAWTAFEFWQTRQNLNSAKTLVGEVSNQGVLTPTARTLARSQLRTAQRKVQTAADALASPPLRVLGKVPGARGQVHAARDLVADAGSILAAGQRMLDDVNTAAGTNVSTSRGADAVLAQIQAGADRLRGALTAGSARRAGSAWWPVGPARTSFNALANRANRRLDDAVDGITAARAFMGSEGPRRYFLAAGNNAEMRDGGMVLSYAVVRFNEGQLKVERIGRIGELGLTRPSSAPMPPGTKAIFGGLNPTGMWQNVNATADTAFSGRAMVAMYKQATGQDVDGVMYLDVPAVAAMLRVLGPLTVEGFAAPLTEANLGQILLNDLYVQAGPRDDPARKEQLADVAAALVRRMTSQSFDLVELAQALGDAAGGRHIWLYSSRAQEQREFERAGVGGSPGSMRPDRTLHVSVQNATASKLDYFVAPRVTVTVHLTENGTAVVRTAVTIKNGAPAGPPSFQLGSPSPEQKRVGEYVTRTYFWGPSVGHQFDSVSESGLRLNQAPISVGPGEEKTLTFETFILNAVRNGRLELRLVPQARLVPTPLTVVLDAPGWKVAGEARIQPAWARAVTVGWAVKR